MRTGAFSFADGDPPALRLHLWPHSSLPRRGFVAFIGITFAMFLLPLLAVLGTHALWALLPFVLGAIALVWYFLARSYRDREMSETLTLWSDRIEVARQNPRKPDQHWNANPHWVRIALDPGSGPVENYLTLSGGDRDVELGAFLTPEERAELHGRLASALAQV